MLIALTSIRLAAAPVQGNSMTTVALVIGAVALLVAIFAYTKASRASASQLVGQVVTALATASASSAGTAGSAAVQGSADNDHQLVAVITAAIAATLASESAVAGSHVVASADASGFTAAASTSSGPYAGFVVRRIRRV